MNLQQKRDERPTKIFKCEEGVKSVLTRAGLKAAAADADKRAFSTEVLAVIAIAILLPKNKESVTNHRPPCLNGPHGIFAKLTLGLALL